MKNLHDQHQNNQINVMFNKEKQTGTRETETHLQKQT